MHRLSVRPLDLRDELTDLVRSRGRFRGGCSFYGVGLGLPLGHEEGSAMRAQMRTSGFYCRFWNISWRMAISLQRGGYGPDIEVIDTGRDKREDEAMIKSMASFKG